MSNHRRKPIELILALSRTHYTKAQIEQRRLEEIHAPNDQVFAPDILTKKQSKDFKEIADQLIELKILTNLDVDSLARYIISRDMYDETTKKLNRLDPLEDIKLYDIYSRIQSRYFRECTQTACELGLNISSRCRLVIPEGRPIVPKRENKFDRFINATRC